MPSASPSRPTPISSQAMRRRSILAAHISRKRRKKRAQIRAGSQRSNAVNEIDLKGRIAIVTGGARGIGLAIAERLARSGARLALWDRDGERAAAAARGIAG